MEDNLYDYIKELENAHREKLAADRREEELSRPLIYDLSRINDVYECFAALIPIYSNEPPTSIDNRRAFIFIVLRLFCPKVFIGKIMPYGFRIVISKLLKCGPSLISYNIRNLTFYYMRYTEFRARVDAIYMAVSNMIFEE